MNRFLIIVLVATLTAARSVPDEHEKEKIMKYVFACCEKTNYPFDNVAESLDDPINHSFCKTPESKAWADCFCEKVIYAQTENENSGENKNKEMPPELKECPRKVSEASEEDRNCVSLDCVRTAQQNRNQTKEAAQM